MPGSILIVDDHPRFRSAARRMLESEGWTVLGEAGDGAEARRAVERLHPDVVLLDVGLPDVSGIDLADDLCAADPGLDVVLTSTHDLADLGGIPSGGRARGFLAKDEISGERLRRLLRDNG